ncbi:MAG: hypothetical protein VKK62_11565 [Synechococcaceae cyanobacterium]|nr:hypothetical protein [Synechococcaceae cyanobacterium]
MSRRNQPPPPGPARSRSGPSDRPDFAAVSASGGDSPDSSEWLSLTDLGRQYGVSAVLIGKMLRQSGLRLSSGEPSPEALRAGLALRQQAGHHHQALWHRLYCAPYVEAQGLEPQRQLRLVGLWADLLHALQQGSPSIAVSAEEMAGDIPNELISPVNRALRQRGCNFQVRPVRRGARPRPVCSPSPVADAGSPHPSD